MFSILALGFLIGMRHTLEADHVAAIAALTARAGSVRQAVPLGLAWGAGHTVTLSAFGLAVLVLEATISMELAGYLELAVGVMLIALGADVLVRLARDRIHFHVHRHGKGVVHFHAHSHTGETVHQHRPRPAHDHDHGYNHGYPRGFKVRAFLVGIMHGMAGSAVLIVLSLQTVPSTAAGLAYIALFGVGSMLGMGMLTAVIAWPLGRWGRTLTWLHNGAKAGVGALTIALGTGILITGGAPF
jgi:ABC-type nickel/cobalt efflux system permease component RcnA